MTAPQRANATLWTPPLSCRGALAQGRRLLEQAGVAEAGLESQLLLAHVVGAGRAWVLAHPDQALARRCALEYGALVGRRVRREPFAYITGLRDWLDLTLRVDRNVLIPRPETEVLARLAVAELAEMGGAPLAVDVGTGSGALAIAMARGYPASRILATDSSGPALLTASLNVRRLAAGRIELVEGDLLAGLAAADLIVANLPYIPSGDLAGLEAELAYEPAAALDGGPDGLAPIRSLLRQAVHGLSPRGVMLLECGYDQAARIASLARAYWPGASISTHADLAGIERFVRIRASGMAGAG